MKKILVLLTLIFTAHAADIRQSKEERVCGQTLIDIFNNQELRNELRRKVMYVNNKVAHYKDDYYKDLYHYNRLIELHKHSLDSLRVWALINSIRGMLNEKKRILEQWIAVSEGVQLYLDLLKVEIDVRKTTMKDFYSNPDNTAIIDGFWEDYNTLMNIVDNASDYNPANYIIPLVDEAAYASSLSALDGSEWGDGSAGAMDLFGTDSDKENSGPSEGAVGALPDKVKSDEGVESTDTGAARGRTRKPEEKEHQGPETKKPKKGIHYSPVTGRAMMWNHYQ